MHEVHADDELGGEDHPLEISSNEDEDEDRPLEISSNEDEDEDAEDEGRPLEISSNEDEDEDDTDFDAYSLTHSSTSSNETVPLQVSNETMMIVVGQYVTVSNEVQTEPTQVETTPSAMQTEATPNMTEQAEATPIMTERAEEIQVETSPNVTLSTMSRRRPREQSEEVGFEPARLLRRTLRGIFRL
jgi:hypothetical protein